MVTSANLDDLLGPDPEPTTTPIQVEQADSTRTTNEAPVAESNPDATTQGGQADPTNPSKPRKTGARKASYDGETMLQLLKTLKSLFRADFAGQNDLEAIEKKMAAQGIQAGPQSCAAIRQLITEQMESCRKRCFPRIDEAMSRLGETPVVEALP